MITINGVAHYDVMQRTKHFRSIFFHALFHFGFIIWQTISPYTLPSDDLRQWNSWSGDRINWCQGKFITLFDPINLMYKTDRPA